MFDFVFVNRNLQMLLITTAVCDSCSVGGETLLLCSSSSSSLFFSLTGLMKVEQTEVLIYKRLFKLFLHQFLSDCGGETGPGEQTDESDGNKASVCFCHSFLPLTSAVDICWSEGFSTTRFLCCVFEVEVVLVPHPDPPSLTGHDSAYKHPLPHLHPAAQ